MTSYTHQQQDNTQLFLHQDTNVTSVRCLIGFDSSRQQNL